MATLTAAQHFFTSVPAEQSPARRRGYQTLCCTRGLPADLIRSIEDRALYSTAPGDPIKRQFYCLGGEYAAIAQTVALAEPDEFGRRGRYLTHTLIVRQRDLAALGYCPLDFFWQFAFETSLEPVLSLARDNQTGAPAISATLTPRWPEIARQRAQTLTPEALTTLGRLAWQADRLLQQGEPVALMGAGAAQLELLAVVFWLASPLERDWLSFDTHAQGCDWPRGVTFWLQGFEQPEAARARLRVEAASGRVVSDLTPALDGPFGRWMAQDVIPNRAERAVANQEYAARLTAVLRGGSTGLRLEFCPPEFLRRFAALNVEAVIARLATAWPSGLSASLSQTLAAPVCGSPETYLSALARGDGPHLAQELAFTGLLTLKAAPPKADRALLEKWIKMTAHPGLLSLLPLWGRDPKSWAESLQGLSDDDYEFCLRALTGWPARPFPLWDGLRAERAATWLKVCAPAIAAGDWKKALPLLRDGGDPAWAALAEHLPHLTGPAQAEVARWLKTYSGEAAPLRQALGLPTPNEKRGFRLFGR
jgi:hypothetical protein